MQKIKELVEFIVKQLVEQPDQVNIVLTTEQDKEILEIHVNPEDRGKVIGKQGQIIKSIRALVNVIVSPGKVVSIDVAQ